MSCCGQREKLGHVRAEQKWGYINLSDFRSTSCFPPLSYGFLYVLLITSVACYAVDLFTAINLLVFDRWSGQVKPYIPFYISRWIFAACIILSWIFLVYRWLRAIRAMRTDGIAASYLDPLAVQIQSIRLGAKGRGWRRFLVFTELTKSKKGTEYVALFTYFSFEAWMRIIFAQGPRQVINALTLYSVMQANLLPNGKHAASHGHTPVAQFFVNVQLLANSNREQAAILFSMLFTLVIWVFSALNLAIALLMYIVFLWHHIPSDDGGLSGYCTRKIETRLGRIVGEKYKKALAKENAMLARVDDQSVKNGELPGRMRRQPTLPMLDEPKDEKILDMMTLSRHTTQSTLPPYTARPSTRDDESILGFHRQPAVLDLAMNGTRPVPPSRNATQSSAATDSSYGSQAPLIGGASAIGYGPPGRSYSPAQLSRKASDTSVRDDRPLISRQATGSSQWTQRSYTPAWGRSTSQARRTPGSRPMGPPTRQNTGMSGHDSVGRTTPGPSPIDPYDYHTKNQWTDPSPGTASGRLTPAQEYEMRTNPQNSGPQRLPSNPQYQAYNPNLHAPSIESAPTINHTSTPAVPLQPQRNFSTPNGAPQADYFGRQPRLPQRSGTAPLPQTATYDDSMAASFDGGYRGVPSRPAVPARAATAHGARGGPAPDVYW
ncbi:hypothetical protein LPUS_10599 [Lasallia pustulata]|uniref:Pheromone-regulated membrane protein n=1 Tax=Lasallia pustulata TaxID=136370 RepID=A0A1W5DA64_9LECA|nr:hypothetical protein LPUS_10599 [Lasallia pustulata]